MSTKLLDTQPIPPEMMVSVSAAAHDALVLELEEMVLAGTIPWNGREFSYDKYFNNELRPWEEDLRNQISAVVADLLCKHVPDLKKKADAWLASEIPFVAFEGFPTRRLPVPLYDMPKEKKELKERFPAQKIGPFSVRNYNRKQQPVGDYTELFGLGISYLFQSGANRPITEYALLDNAAENGYVEPLIWHYDGPSPDGLSILMGEQGIKGAETTLLPFEMLLQHPALAPYKDLFLEERFIINEPVEEACLTPLFIDDGTFHVVAPKAIGYLAPDVLRSAIERGSICGNTKKAQAALVTLADVFTALTLRLHTHEKYATDSEYNRTYFQPTKEMFANMQAHEEADRTIVPYGIQLGPGKGLIFNTNRISHARTGYKATKGSQRAFTFVGSLPGAQELPVFTPEEIAQLKAALPDAIRERRERFGFPTTPHEEQDPEAIYEGKRFRSNPTTVERLKAQREDDSSKGPTR